MKIEDLKTRYDIGLVLNELGLTGTGAEIGVAFGENAEQILDKSQLMRLLLIDPWSYVPDQNPVGYGDVINNWRSCKDHCRKRLSRFGVRAQIMSMTSEDGSRSVEDGSLDFVYIDANHMSPWVNQDIAMWWPKVRVGGVFGGHDYYDLITETSHFDVKSAVDGFVEQNQLRLYPLPSEDSSWYVIKES